MATLTKVSITTRKIIRYSIFGVIALIIAKFTLDTTIQIYRYFFPVPPPPPTVAFGKLPKLDFRFSEGNLTFSLETPEGSLPILATQAKVFFMPKPSPNLLSLESATEKAVQLGFLPDAEVASQTIYRFRHKNVPSTLESNIVTGVFSLSYDLAEDLSAIERIPPASEIAASLARSYLSSADLLPEDLTGPTAHSFLKIESEQLVPALGQADADLIRVNLFRKDYDELPTLPPDPNEANVWFMISGARERYKQIIASEFHYFPVDETQLATYPLKTAETAWEELQAGHAYIAISGGEGTIVIRRVYLAYYDSGTPAEFLQPIVVFEGDNNFTAYVPAVTSDYYGE